MKQIFLFLSILITTTFACGTSTPSIPPAPQDSVFSSTKTTYGFFPSPPEVTLESVFNTFKDIGQHADFVFIQPNIAWKDFEKGADGESRSRSDLINQVKLARQNNLEYIFVMDALNGPNRREFAGLPAAWDANFENPKVRSAYKNYALWVVKSFHPHYFGLASEINSYMDAHPEDAKNFIGLYNEIYSLIKAESPETQVFVSFQWDDLNNMFPQPEEGNRKKI